MFYSTIQDFLLENEQISIWKALMLSRNCKQ